MWLSSNYFFEELGSLWFARIDKCVHGGAPKKRANINGK